MTKFNTLFKVNKPLIAKIQLNGKTNEDVLKNAKKEIDIYYSAGVDAVLVENFYGNYHQMHSILDYLNEDYADRIYGVNVLGFDALSFELANEFDADFIQINHIAGKYDLKDDISMQAFLDLYRSKTKALVFGTISNYDLETLMSVEKRADALITNTVDKVNISKKALSDYPVIVEEMTELEKADGAIICTLFKKDYNSENEVVQKQVEAIVSDFRKYRD